MRNCMLIVLALWSLSGETRANCVSDLTGQQSKLMMCIAELGSSMATIDPSNPLAMCKGKVKENFDCLLNYIAQCPQLNAVGSPFSSMAPAVEQYTIACATNATRPAEACPQLNACMHNFAMLDESKSMDPSGESTPFSMIPAMAYSLCSQFKGQFDCIDANRAACPNEVKMIEESLSGALASGQMMPLGLDGVKMVVQEKCPRMPAGFPSNTCVRRELEGPSFVDCFSMIKQTSKQASKEELCMNYNAGRTCINTHIGGPCGQENANAIIDMATLIIEDPPQGCQISNKMSDDGKNEADKSRVILATFLLCLLAAFFQNM